MTSTRTQNVLFTLLSLVLFATLAYGDGCETFDNFPGTSSTYTNGTFLGQDGSTWSYMWCRGDLHIFGKSPCLAKGRTPAAEVSSGTLYDGCATLSFYYQKAFSTAVNLDVKVNGALITTVVASDTNVNYTGDIPVNVTGEFVITIVQHNTSAGQVTIDNIAWTSIPDDPNIVVHHTLPFGEVGIGSVNTQSLTVSNTGTSQTLNVEAFLPASGDTDVFALITALPLSIGPNGSSDVINAVYDPGFVTGANHSAVFQLLCNDPSDPTNNITLSGSTPNYVTVSNIQYTTDPSGVSPLSGQTVRVTATVTYVDPHGFVIADDGGGPWSGVYVYDAYHRPEYGDRVALRGTVDEYYSFTEIINVTTCAVVSASNSIPAAVVTALALANEQYEGG